MRRATVLVAACALALLAIAVTVNGLTFKTSRLDLLNPRSEYNQRWLAYLAEFGDRDDACLVVRAERHADLTAAIDDLAAQLRQEPKLFDSVFYRRDLSRLKGKALHYLPADSLLSSSSNWLPRRPCCRGRAKRSIRPMQLQQLNDELAHVSASTPERRARIEEQYARAAGMLLAALGRPVVPHRPGACADCSPISIRCPSSSSRNTSWPTKASSASCSRG